MLNDYCQLQGGAMEKPEYTTQQGFLVTEFGDLYFVFCLILVGADHCPEFRTMYADLRQFVS